MSTPTRMESAGLGEKECEYVGKHQEALQGLLMSVSTQEVRESLAAEATLEDTMHMQSRTGVIYATTRARQWGFNGAGDPDWGNLGQGAPETSPIPNQPERKTSIDLHDEQTNEYGNVNGRPDLRQAIADYYNHWYRQGKASKYGAANVAVVAGGRSGLCRLMATLKNVNVGYFLPDYTAYSQLLGAFTDVSPIPVAHDQPDGITTSAAHLRQQIRLHGLAAFLLSNPGNPTGKPIEGKPLDEYVQIARDEHCLMLMDEFYNHYMYEPRLEGDSRPFHTFSSAEHVVDVDKDPICIINGFTKNWRLPGWRVCWVVGPKHCIDVLSSVGSFMDGGANNPLQKAAVPFLNPEFVVADALALQAHFRAKRDYMIKELGALGIKARVPEATFYIWADVSGLPAPLNNGVIFFEYCVRHKVICVPGIFFDINPFQFCDGAQTRDPPPRSHRAALPSHQLADRVLRIHLHSRRRFHKSPYIDHLRMSFGPAWPNLHQAIAGMKSFVEAARAGTLPPLEQAKC